MSGRAGRRRRWRGLPLRIGRISVEGASPEEEVQLRSRIRLKTGDAFDHFRSLDAARTARAWFIARDYLEAAVDVHDATVEGAGVDLTVHVVRGPRVRIEWRGDDPGRALRARVRDGWNSVLPRDERAARLAREVRLGIDGRALLYRRGDGRRDRRHRGRARRAGPTVVRRRRGIGGSAGHVRRGARSAGRRRRPAVRGQHGRVARRAGRRPSGTEHGGLLRPARARRIAPARRGARSHVRHRGLSRHAGGHAGLVRLRGGRAVRRDHSDRGGRAGQRGRARASGTDPRGRRRSAGIGAARGGALPVRWVRVGSRAPAGLVPQRGLPGCPCDQCAGAQARRSRRPVSGRCGSPRHDGSTAHGARRSYAPVGVREHARDDAGRGDSRVGPRGLSPKADADRHLPIGRSPAQAGRRSRERP